ncbi:DNA damage checkpoint control protein RAD17 [Nakaseomyces bracarensis]|uniref:DNA damage checkpoint control protein RAD17 n=1 Tax=Nakaseomyces bracarensis TaxID=273131 RepID=A0ABR4NTN7_9SACH
MFSASTVHLEHITTALGCLTPFGKDDVVVYIDADGLSFVKDSNGVIRISLLLAKELFVSYSYESRASEVQNDYMKLCVKINHILDSVSVVNKNLDDIVECILSYEGDGSPFVLTFDDSMISERVEYSTFMVRDMDASGLELDREHIIFECILKGDVMYAALRDFKEIGCKDVYLYANATRNGENTLAFISRSQLGLSKIKFPSNRTVIEKLEIYENDSQTRCFGVPVIGYFNFSSFDKIRMSTKIASKILLRMDVHGILSVNILSHTDSVVAPESNGSTKPSTTLASKSSSMMQLPKDYPGIVIDVCMVEKEALDDLAQEELISFMNDNPTNSQQVRNNEILQDIDKESSQLPPHKSDTSAPLEDDIPIFF